MSKSHPDRPSPTDAMARMQSHAGDASALLKAMGNEQRLLVLCQLVDKELSVGELLAGIKLSQSALSQHLAILREADAIAREELTAAGLDREVWQFPVVLLADVRSVGVQGDGRTYGHPIVLRPVSSEDAMTADWTRVPYEVLERISTRITNEVPEVNRVVLDVTSKPPGTIEWE